MTYYDLNMNGKLINNCQDPSANQDVATKNYVDTFNFPLNDKIANYILAASDNNQRITMTNAGSTTITVNNNIFSANDTIYFINKDTGTTTITAGAGVTINNAAGLVLAQNQSGTLVAESASRFFFS